MADDVRRLRVEVGRSVVGQAEVVEPLLTGLLAGGHVLLARVPGLAKTLLVMTVARSLGDGRVLAEAEADRLTPLLRTRTFEVVRSRRIALGEIPAALALFFGLLAAEWDFRKRVGLPGSGGS